MKRLMRIVAALLAGAMAFTFASCDDDDDGVTEVSEWDLNYTESTSSYWVDWEIDFYSNGTFEIDLDVETSAASDVDVLDVVFAKGTYTGDATSGTVTMTVTGVIAGYEKVMGGTFSGVSTTWVSDSAGTVTLTATITAGTSMTITSSSLSGKAGSGTDISAGWTFSYNW